MQCDLDLEDMTLGQGHDTTLGHGQQLCEILSKSNLTVVNYGLNHGHPDKSSWLSFLWNDTYSKISDAHCWLILPIFTQINQVLSLIQSSYIKFFYAMSNKMCIDRENESK